MFARLRSLARAIFSRSRWEKEMRDELQFHIEQHTEHLAAAGVPREEAARRARVEFGAVESYKESCREAHGLRLIDELRTNFRYALRSFRKNPGFTAAAVLSVAFGIGANTAIFTLLNKVMLQSLPVKDAAQLVIVEGDGFSFPEYRELLRRNDVFAGLLALGFEPREVPLGVSGKTEPVLLEAVSGNYFEILGANAMIGRAITPEDDRASATPVTVLSYGFWQRRLGGARGVLGQAIDVNGQPFTVIGVTPPGFAGARVDGPPDLYVAVVRWWATSEYKIDDSVDDRGFMLMGRLKPGVSRGKATASLKVLFRQIQENLAPLVKGENERKDFLARQIAVNPGSGGFSRLRERFSRPLVALMAVVAMVLLIACANMASLFLARATARSREMAVRVALGAGRGRLMRQFMTEGLMLACAGGSLGVLLAWWSCGALVAALPDVHLQVTPDLRVLGFTLAVCLFTGVLFSLAPALHASRADAGQVLKDEGSALTGGMSRLALRKGLIVAQVGWSVVLLAGAGLFIRSLQNWKDLDAGVERVHILSARVWTVRPAAYTSVRWEQVFRSLIEHVRGLPGVRSAGLKTFSPGYGDPFIVSVEGYIPHPDENMYAWGASVTSGYFETLGVEPLGGRTWTVAEDSGRAGVAVVSQTFAKRFFDRRNPIGRKLKIQATQDQFEIIGIVKDVKHFNLRWKETLPLVYFPMASSAQSWYLRDWGRMARFEQLSVRTAGDPARMVPAVRRVLEAQDENLAVRSVKTMQEQLGEILADERLLAWLSGFFGLLATMLTAIGLYGVITYSVLRRTREIGLRVALGAGRLQILGLVLREVQVLVATGIALGVPAALALSKFASSLLFGISPTDTLTMTGASLLMCAVAIVAGMLPAHRATQVDPVTALRCE